MAQPLRLFEMRSVLEIFGRYIRGEKGRKRGKRGRVKRAGGSDDREDETGMDRVKRTTVEKETGGRGAKRK